MALDEDQVERLERVFSADNLTKLSEWEKDQFLPSLREKFEQYGADTRVSPKQWAIIERIESKL